MDGIFEKLYDTFSKTQVIIFVSIIMAILAVLIVALVIASKPIQKWKKVLTPTYEDGETKNRKFRYDENAKKQGKLKEATSRAMRKNGLDKKINRWYMQAGMEGKTYEDFIYSNLKYVAFGIIAAFIAYVLFGNLIISVVALLLFSCLHILDIFGSIRERRRDFTEEFPFFLKTLSFVLENGANMAVAFKEVTSKVRPSILKDIMSDVQEIQMVNGGDFVSAFRIIPERINSDEAREFVGIVENNYEKGIPIAETFSLQSDLMTNIINAKKLKKVKNLDNKMMLPLIGIFAAVALLIWAGFSGTGTGM